MEDVFRRPATGRTAEILGVRNLFYAHVVAATPEGLTLDWDGLELEALPQPAGVGETVTAYIRPEDIKVLYADRPLGRAVARNGMAARILDSRFNGGFRTLRIALPNGREVEARFPVHSYRPLPLAAGEEVRVSLRKEGLVILRGHGAGTLGSAGVQELA